jgi:hypothetical protein
MGTMAPIIRDHRIPARITHTTSEIPRARIFAMHVAELPGCGRSGRSTEGPGLQLNIPWRHEIQTDDRLEPDVLETHPGCTGGRDACPPSGLWRTGQFHGLPRERFGSRAMRLRTWTT